MMAEVPMGKTNLKIFSNFYDYTVSYDEIKQKVITQANSYHRVKAYTQ